jgi:hypothetical protein
MPNSFAESQSGLLLIVSGFDPVLRWDGLKPSAEVAGMSAPTVAPTIAASGTGTINGSYTAYLRFVDDLGNVSNLSPISNTLTATLASTITYTNVQIPTDPKVKRRQLLRSTAGQAATYYVDVDSTDITATTFQSTKTDSQLNVGEAVPILDPSDNSIFANRHNPPPNYKIAIVNHLGRMFMAGELDYTQGSCKVTFGSATVQGVGTEWLNALVGRLIYVVGARQSYQIATIDETNQTLTLTEVYQDATDYLAPYAIRPAPAERKLVYYSEAGLPESWPPTNALSVQDDGDEITGLMVKGSFVYIVERRHVYRFTFQEDPALDGFLFLSSKRGCLNPRSFVVVEDIAYMLDEQGIHAFSGADDKPISTTIQDVFRPSDSPYRINWKEKRFFHCCHFPQQETIRWYVSMAGDYLPQHAIAYNYRLERWWIEEYSRPIGSSCTGLYLGQQQVFLGSDGRSVMALWQGLLDGPQEEGATVRGTVTSCGLTSITDATATFPSTGVVNNPVVIAEGRGAGQRRNVSSVSGQTIYVDEPWLILPDTTSVYQLGGIQWHYTSAWFRFVLSEQYIERRVATLVEPTLNDARMTLQVFVDFANTPISWQASMTSEEGGGVQSTAGGTDLLIDMKKTSGYAQKRMAGNREFFTDGPRYTQLKLSGVTSRDAQRVYFVAFDAVTQ